MRAGRPKDRRQHFEQRIEQLIAFRKHHDSWPEAQGRHAEERSLGTWCKKLKELYKIGRLESYCIERLHQIGYPMDFIEANWQNKFECLKNYIEKHHRLPGCREGLYSFCYHQLRSASELSEEKILQLKTIGFFDLWEQRKEAFRNRWHVNFKKLQQFIAVNDQLPSGKKEIYLQNWIRVQKQLFRKGKLHVDRIKRLQDVGIDLQVKPAAIVSWEERLDELRIYYLKNEELPIYKMDRKLYSWLLHQRNSLEQGKLNREKINQLNAMDIQWAQRKRRQKVLSMA